MWRSSGNQLSFVSFCYIVFAFCTERDKQQLLDIIIIVLLNRTAVILIFIIASPLASSKRWKNNDGKERNKNKRGKATPRESIDQGALRVNKTKPGPKRTRGGVVSLWGSVKSELEFR